MTATELKTAEMILALKQVARARYGGTPHCLPSRAADWLYHLQTQLGKIYQERDEARAELEQVKRQSVKAITLTWSGPAATGGGGGKSPGQT